MEAERQMGSREPRTLEDEEARGEESRSKANPEGRKAREKPAKPEGEVAQVRPQLSVGAAEPDRDVTATQGEEEERD